MPAASPPPVQPFRRSCRPPDAPPGTLTVAAAALALLIASPGRAAPGDTPAAQPSAAASSVTGPGGAAAPAPTPAARPGAGSAGAAADTPPRPRVGLVLGGGGARGSAHIGVLEVLEQLRVPVDCIAGTSMGALVAGAWAAGVRPQEMREVLARTDWSDMFIDNPGYAELDFRAKRLAQRFLPGTETGISARGAIAPPGVVSGQKIKLFINTLVRADTGERLIEKLPLPVSIVATDIGSGERVVYRDGALTQAMRASMAVPGLLAPVEYGGRKLVDGGLVDNVPIAEVRERCGAEVVIAVNVGSPMLRPEDIGGLLSISAQMVALLTEQNVTRSLATLTPTDIYLQPDLGTVTAGSFDRHAEAADRGRAAAEAIAGRLQALAVDEARFAAWRQHIDGRLLDVPRIDAIEIADLGRVNPVVVRRYLQQQVGEPLDTELLNRDLLRAYGDGHYAGVDYSLVRQRDRTILRITPMEKPWGPDYLRAAVTLESTLSQGSTYQLRAGYQKTWLNRLGGELLFNAELGSSTGLGAEWYQPLDAAQRFFVDLQADYRRERLDVYSEQQRVAELRLGRQRAELTAGVNLALLGQVRFGWRETRQTTTLVTGPVVIDPDASASAGGWLLAFDLDRLDRLYFPTRGWALRGSLFDSRRRDYARLNVELRGAVPWGDWIVASRLRSEGAVRGQLPLDDAAFLGGFLNLTGYAKGQLIGDRVVYGHVRAERIVGRLPLGLRGDMRLGTALELGRVGTAYNPQRHDGWLGSLALYLGGETPIGSVYVGFGQGRGGARNAYLFIGTP